MAKIENTGRPSQYKTVSRGSVPAHPKQGGEAAEQPASSQSCQPFPVQRLQTPSAPSPLILAKIRPMAGFTHELQLSELQQHEPQLQFYLLHVFCFLSSFFFFNYYFILFERQRDRNLPSATNVHNSQDWASLKSTAGNSPRASHVGNRD